MWGGGARYACVLLSGALWVWCGLAFVFVAGQGDVGPVVWLCGGWGKRGKREAKR